jgi:HEAT repeat protein
MMGRSRANEIPKLVRQLASRDRTRFESARARLLVAGERAVEELIEALEGDDHVLRARVMPLLALIQDPRAREPLTAMLLDRHAGLRGIAARGLGRFPCPNSVRALTRLLERETSEHVKVAAVHALVDSYESGCDEAIAPLLRLLGFPHESGRVRLAALAVARLLPPSQRRGVLARLEQDEEPSVREKSRELRASLENDEPAGSAEIARLLAELGSDDYTVWNEALARLASVGAPIVRPLLGEMQRRAADPEYCTRVGMALRTLGPRRAAGLSDALEVLEEPGPLLVLVEVVGALGEKSMIYRLAGVIERIAARESPAAEAALLQRVRAKAHLALARVGSRVAIADLRESLTGHGGRRVEPEVLAAVELVGKREELGLLLRCVDSRDDFIVRGVARAVREIMKRERIRRNSRALGSLSAEQRSALDRILGERLGERLGRPGAAPRPGT